MPKYIVALEVKTIEVYEIETEETLTHSEMSTITDSLTVDPIHRDTIDIEVREITPIEPV